MMFRPEQDEVLTGTIRGCSRDGVTVSLGFFDDILIPGESLQQPSRCDAWPGGTSRVPRYDEAESVWVWEYPTEEEGRHHDLFMDPGERVRLRVTGETFVDRGPSKPVVPGAEGQEPEEPRAAPYSLAGSCSEPGLGLLSWWT
jgi:DNA-directed RNA polymerase III subunit RPC8